MPVAEIGMLVEAFRKDISGLEQGKERAGLERWSPVASILWCSAFFIDQLSHPYMTTGKTIALTRRTLVGKVMSLLLNILSRSVITFLPRSKCLLISWLQSPSAVILELVAVGNYLYHLKYERNADRMSDNERLKRQKK